MTPITLTRRPFAWILLLVVALWTGSASPALAQYAGKGSLDLTGYGGGYFGGTVYTGSSGTIARDVQVGDDWSYGGRLEYVMSRALGLELGYGRSNSDLKVNAGGGYPQEPIGDLTENRYELNLNFYTHPGHTQGYFTIGGGATHFSADFDDGTNTASASETRFTGNLGLGFKLHTSPKLALRVDGRWRYTDTNVGGTDYYCDAFGFCYAYDNSYYSSGEVTGGLTYTLK